MKRTRSIFAALALAALLGPGCSGDDTPTKATGTIGKSGGSVTVGKASVVVPGGALGADVEIGIEKISSGWPGGPAGMELAGDVYAFTPHGTGFASPATVTVPVKATSSDVKLYKYSPGESGWVEISGATVNIGDSTITGLTTSFSGFAGWKVAIVGGEPKKDMGTDKDTSTPNPDQGQCKGVEMQCESSSQCCEGLECIDSGGYKGCFYPN